MRCGSIHTARFGRNDGRRGAAFTKAKNDDGGHDVEERHPDANDDDEDGDVRRRDAGMVEHLLHCAVTDSNSARDKEEDDAGEKGPDPGGDVLDNRCAGIAEQ